MALILAMQEDRAFYVGDVRVVVSEIRSSTHVKLTVMGGLEAVYNLSPNATVEILPQVKVCLGLGSTPAMAKIAIEAPKNLRILRDALYERPAA